MRRINRLVQPAFWENYRKKNPNENYDDLQNSEEGRMVRNELRNYLVKSQYYLCAYCCCKIDSSNSLNEHIKPRGDGCYSKFSMDYDNIIASCRSKVSCSAEKKNAFDEALFVSPLEDDCDKHFKYYVDGEIEGVTEKGKYTYELLGLNNYSLKRARMAQLKVCEALNDSQLVKDYYLTPVDGELEPYADIVEYFYNLGYFDVKDE